MRRRRLLPRSTALPLLGAASLMLVTACKPQAGASAPARSLDDWSLAEIEAELARNDAVLSDAGIQVAAVSMPTVPAGGGSTSPEPPPDDDGGGDASTEIGSDVPDPVEEPVYDYEDEVAPTMSAPEPEPEPEPMADEAEYDRAERTSRSRRRRENRRSAKKDRGRCNRVCDIAEATCELEVQICELAERHPDEPRYEQACLRAEQQCLAASQACLRCQE